MISLILLSSVYSVISKVTMFVIQEPKTLNKNCLEPIKMLLLYTRDLLKNQKL